MSKVNRASTRESSGRTVRCAIYTRKSSDEGLGQQFNTLEAQRAGGEAFVQSRASEGWECLPARYDDGGFSGGTMERPALKRLLEDVNAGRVDVIVIYKIDRLTRSIRDFARIMETLDAKRVAIAAVSQSINTQDSMGRLMVHVLMSFAQFERELASERTRDKIALSRQRGLWTGGRPVLGYDFAGCKLVLNADEAVTVRAIFGMYLECRSLRQLLRDLAEREITNKKWTTRDGRVTGGKPFVLSGIAQLLSNPLYIGKVPHRGTHYDGAHEAIVDPLVFRRVQELLAENGRSGASLVRNRHGGLLKGVLRCGSCGATMVHSTTTKKGEAAYRYYTCRTRQLHGRGRCKGGSAPAEQIETFVIEKVRHGLAEPRLVTLVLDAVRAEHNGTVRNLEARGSLLATQLEAAERAALAGAPLPIATFNDLREQSRRLNQELASARESAPSRGDIETGVRDFEAMWVSLSPTERARLLALLIESVTYDAERGSLNIALREDGSDPTAHIRGEAA